MRTIKLLSFLLLAAFAAGLRAKPFPGDLLPGPIVEPGWFRAEGAADALRTAIERKAGARGLSFLGLGLFGTAAALAAAAASAWAGFGPGTVLAALLLPLGLGVSAPDGWLFSSAFAATFLWVAARAGLRLWPPAVLFVLPVLTALWPLFHAAGAALGPALCFLILADAWAERRKASTAGPSGEEIPASDPLLFREADIDLPALLKVLSWETKMNQLVHQKLGLTPAELPRLSARRAVEVLNSFLEVPDLALQAAVPDPSGPDVRARNRRILEIQYQDALRKPEPGDGDGSADPVPLWAPAAAAVLALAAAVFPAGAQAAARAAAAAPAAFSVLADPSRWWVLVPSRDSQPAMPYFWIGLGLHAGTAAFAFFKNRGGFSVPSFFGGLAFFAWVVAVPEAAPLAAVAVAPLAAAGLKGARKEDTLTRMLVGAAGLIALLVGLMLADWDRMPMGPDSLDLGRLEPPAAR